MSGIVAAAVYQGKAVRYLLFENVNANDATLNINIDESFTCKSIWVKEYQFWGVTADPVIVTNPYTSHFAIQTDNGTNFRFNTFKHTDLVDGVPLLLNPSLNTTHVLATPTLACEWPGAHIASLRIRLRDDRGNLPQYTRCAIGLVCIDCTPINQSSINNNV